MKQISIPNYDVILNIQDGVDMTKQKLSGTCTVSDDTKQVKFTQDPIKVKSKGKNPVVFDGNFMTARLHSSTGASQLTMRLAANTNIAEIRGALIDEFVSAIDRWNM